LRAISACANWATFTMNINVPTASTSIQDLTICKNTTTTIDAGLGFIHYKWSNGTDGQFARTADYGIGTHFVELTSPNGCVYKQTFTISATESPKITNIEVTGTTATISVTGGEAPYQYSIDGINYQNSNIFSNIPRGTHTVYVKDSKACEIIQSQFLIINLINAITPNGDGINDVLDYSDLRIKDNVSIKIFDRHGATIYQSEGKNYTWDGKSFGRNVTSGTYWYVITWTEPLTQVPTAYSGWILVKNRN
jgi:gliding motility-associated-like protein